jgi:hypothetical protein
MLSSPWCEGARRPRRTKRTLRACLGVALAMLAAPGHAQLALERAVTGADLQRYANGVLSLMAYTIAPDVTTGSLSIQDAVADNPDLAITQLGGGFVVSETTRIYLEGNAAYSRYDPRFLITEGAEDRVVPLKWNSLSATGGIGYDFVTSSKWTLRPIFNFTLGHVASDMRLGQAFLERRTGQELDFIDGGQLNAYGLGGSVMLTYKHFKPERELELEVRYTNVYLRSFGSTSDAVTGEASAESVIVWSRMRVPSGWVLLQRPVRYVFELAYSNYLDSGVEALGFNELMSFGLGIELDSSAYDIWATRWRAVLRHVVGPNVSGWSLGLAVSF